jgi:hypothetical protein
VTARFDDGKVFMRDKSHFKNVRERSCFERQEREREKTSEDINTSTFQDNILDRRRTNQNTRNAVLDRINHNEAEDKSINQNSSSSVSNNNRREPIYVTRRGREIYRPERFQS